MADLKPASSPSVPQVVKVSVPPSLSPPESDPEVEKPPQPASAGTVAAAAVAARKCRRVSVMGVSSAVYAINLSPGTS